jgi:hypothetical protein
VWIDAAEEPGRPDARRHQARPLHDPHTHGGVRGLEVSLGGLGQDQLIQRQIGDRPAQPAILGFQLLQPLDLVALKTTVLIPPA